jgi:hypothetical protein
MGVETLGNYMTEYFADPIRSNLLACLVTLHAAIGLDIHALRLHKEDVRTTHHDCPGINMDKNALIRGTHDQIVAHEGGEHSDTGLA